MGTGLLISKYLSEEAQSALLTDLVEQEKFDQVVDILDSQLVDFSNKKALHELIFEKLIAKLNHIISEVCKSSNGDYLQESALKNNELQNLAKLAIRLLPVWKLFENWLFDHLLCFIIEKKEKLFNPNLYQNVIVKLIAFKQDPPKNVERYDDNGFCILLRALETCYQSDYETKGLPFNKIDRLVMGLLACDNEVIGILCSNLTKWRIPKITLECLNSSEFDELNWSCTKEIIRNCTTHPWKQKVYLVYLLRFHIQSHISEGLIAFMGSNLYWLYIKDAMAHEEQEYRKLGLSILKISVQGLSEKVEGFQTELFTWNPAKRSETIQTWERFTSLFEIVSLESALNQIEAASGHILELFNDPILHPSWGLILFTTGLKASMESIRRYMMSLLFRIENTAAFSTDIVVLKNHFLPNAMEAHYFAPDGKSCAYGETLAILIASIISNSGKQLLNVLDAIFEVLVKYGTSYDPARIYLSYGVLMSLKKSRLRVLSVSQLQYVKKLFEFESEEMIFETTLQTIYLRYLLHVDSNLSPVQWIKCIVSHIKSNRGDYRYVMPLLDSMKDYAVTYFDMNSASLEIMQHIGNDNSFDVIAAILFKNIDVTVDQSFLSELAKIDEFSDQYRQEASHILNQLLTGQNLDGYECANIFIELPCFGGNTWKSVQISSVLNSLIESFCFDKFTFFVAVLKKGINYNSQIDELKWFDVLKIYSILKQHIEIKNTDFKTKDKAYGVYFQFVLLFIQANALEDSELSQLFVLLNNNVTSDNGNFEGNLGVSNVCLYLLEHYINFKVPKGKVRTFEAFNITSIIWETLKTERLVLKQRDLHMSIIRALFHYKILYHACILDDLNSVVISEKLSEYGDDILKQAESRRSILPLLGNCICNFIKNYGISLVTNESNYGWFITLMASAFALEQTKVNIFRIKPVIGDLYDKKICLYNESKNGLYSDMYGYDEIYAKISIIDALLTAPQDFKEAFVKKLVSQNNFLAAKRKTDGDEELQRLLKWQLVMLCAPSVKSETLLEICEKRVFDAFLTEFSPSIRIYMEWLIAFAFAQNYDEKSPIFLENQIFSVMDDHSKPILVVGAQRILFIVLKFLRDRKNNERLLSRFTSALVSNATSNKPLVRHFSNSLTLSYWPLFGHTITDTTLKSIMKELYETADSQKSDGQYRAGDANLWNLYDDLTLTGIFGGVLKKILDHELPYISKQQFEKYLSNEEGMKTGDNEYDLWLRKRAIKSINNATSENALASSQFQTKSGAWETMFDVDDNDTAKNVKRSDLIVIASLVDKPPNLGGICRLCDVLGVGLLTVQDLRVKNHPQFKNVAVTADRWMPMEEIPVNDIIKFMKEKKKEGYTLIGLEQTDQSVKLDNDYKFPKKSLILLGIEALGIPGYLLSELDVCIEIKQFGVIRSMNIQTATAVIVHSYTVQHM